VPGLVCRSSRITRTVRWWRLAPPHGKIHVARKFLLGIFQEGRWGSTRTEYLRLTQQLLSSCSSVVEKGRLGPVYE